MAEIWQQERVTGEGFAACYDLLAATFDPAVLTEAERLRPDVAAPPQPDFEYVLIARSTPDKVISLIAGCYLSLAGGFAGNGIGFIEYMVTREGYRQQGHASAVLNALESALQGAATARGENLRLVFGEVDADMIPFKQRRGYQTISGSRYQQPPISFDPISGAPLCEPVPMHLMFKVWGARPDRGLLLACVDRIFRARYLPKNATPDAVQAALRYLHEQVFRPFAESLKAG